MPIFTAEELTEICLNVFQKLNIPAAEAEVVTKSMVDANRCLLYTSPSPRDRQKSRMPSSA